MKVVSSNKAQSGASLVECAVLIAFLAFTSLYAIANMGASATKPLCDVHEMRNQTGEPPPWFFVEGSGSNQAPGCRAHWAAEIDGCESWDDIWSCAN